MPLEVMDSLLDLALAAFFGLLAWYAINDGGDGGKRARLPARA
jgi:hypothetical protein